MLEATALRLVKREDVVRSDFVGHFRNRLGVFAVSQCERRLLHIAGLQRGIGESPEGILDFRSLFGRAAGQRRIALEGGLQRLESLIVAKDRMRNQIIDILLFALNALERRAGESLVEDSVEGCRFES